MARVNNGELEFMCELHKGLSEEDTPVAAIYARDLRDLRKAVLAYCNMSDGTMTSTRNITDVYAEMKALLPQDGES